MAIFKLGFDNRSSEVYLRRMLTNNIVVNVVVVLLVGSAG